MSTALPPDDPLTGPPAPPPEVPVVVEPLPHAAPAPASGRESLVGQDVVVALAADAEPPYRRRVWLPLILFLTTCATTFLAGCYHWQSAFLGEDMQIRGPFGLVQQVSFVDIIRNGWREGLMFMVCVMSVLLMHEMGHFVMALRHRVPASFPYFIPVPIAITGTMGAVISMDGSRANRKELFDIGLAGPLAGLVLTIPMVIIGLLTGEAVHGHQHFGNPLLVKLLLPYLRSIPPNYHIQPNAIYMAGWVGMLITGLNMLPVSQLDGGHVAYAVLGHRARWLARLFIVTAVLFMVYTRSNNWWLMLLIIVGIGIDHPPTADDKVRLGPLRWVLGLLSLLIPIFCFTPFPMY